jgi:hypothetical protein
MAKRWTYAYGQVRHDPLGQVARLLAEKVPQHAEERRWMLMSGLILSHWYAHDLTNLWVLCGNLASAHRMFDEALNHFFDLLFGLNDQLTPDIKWRYYCVERLEHLPVNFRARFNQVLQLREVNLAELERRKAAFMNLWSELRPQTEREVGLTFEEMVLIV